MKETRKDQSTMNQMTTARAQADDTERGKTDRKARATTWAALLGALAMTSC